MSTEETRLTVHQPNMGLVLEIGKYCLASGMFPTIRHEAQAVVKILAGAELGFPPIYSLRKISVIQGQIQLGAELIGALLKRTGRYNYQVTEHTNLSCTIVFTENGKAVYSSTFTMKDAEGANLLKTDSSWQKYPRAMLFSRALSQGARIVAPELIAGVYTPEEFGLQVDEQGEAIPGQEPPPMEARAQTKPQEEQATDLVALRQQFEALARAAGMTGIATNEWVKASLGKSWSQIKDSPMALAQAIKMLTPQEETPATEEDGTTPYQ